MSEQITISLTENQKIALLTLLYHINEGNISVSKFGFTKTDLKDFEIVRNKIKSAHDINVVS